MRKDKARAAMSCCAAVLVAAAFVAGGCGSSDDSSSTSGSATGSGDTGSTTTDKPVKVAVLVQSLTSYTGPLAKGAAAEGKKDGATLETFSANDDPALQLRQCQDAIASGKFEGMLLNAVDNVAILPCIKQAASEGMKVVNAGQVIGPDYLSTEIQVPELSGQVIVPHKNDVAVTDALVDEACKGHEPCKVAWLAAEPAYTYSAKKLEGAKKEFKASGQELVATARVGFDNPDGALNAVRNIMQAHPDVNVIVGDDDSSLQGVVRLKKQGDLPEDVALIGDGGNAAALQSIKDGDQFGTVYNGPYTIGEEAMRLLVDQLRGKEVPNNNINAFDVFTPKGGKVDQANVDQAKAEW